MRLVIYAKHEFKSLKAQIFHAAYQFSRLHTHCILKLFDVIFSSIQLSQDFKVTNGRPLNRKIKNKQVSLYYKRA